jgi:cellulose synthase operon protein YhjQ
MTDKNLTNEPEGPVSETPEDVAILYSWANLHGAKYRDFSASRREYRAQVRHRIAEETRVAELKAQAQAETAAAEAERRAREAERALRSSERFARPIERDQAQREAEESSRRAAAEYSEAARRAEAAAVADAAARREEREIADAHASAQRQAARWYESDLRRRGTGGPRPPAVPALSGDPYEIEQGASVNPDLNSPNRQLDYTQPQRYREDVHPEPFRTDFSRAAESRTLRQTEFDLRRRGYRPDEPSGLRPVARSTGGDTPSRSRPSASGEFARSNPLSARDGAAPTSQPSDQAAPAWLYGSNPAGRPASQASSVAHTLQSSREKVASRWFALKGVFEPEPQVDAAKRPRRNDASTPMLAVFSLAGGVGKTSLVATLGRALSSLGEKVLLADTTSHGLLPYYFGATELKPGVVRTFSPPSGSTDAAIHLVSYDVEPGGGNSAAQETISDEMTNSAAAAQRLVVDLNANSGWLIRRLNHLPLTVLVPLAPDMNSVISLQTVERYFEGVQAREGRVPLPYYLINQFDPSLPLHLDVREVLRRQLGERLLPYVIRRSPAVSEALAEGMTVVDYQPDGSATEDYLNVAKWLRSTSAPAAQAFRTTRWSER